ncbi:MAG TPA: hypothetical protein PKH65_00865 [Bacteroidia bacterium]|nr:hypothetical protein [Bacteroidia bacterium]HNT79203.1 hypothetical protein [Bacteroidia bacterium]
MRGFIFNTFLASQLLFQVIFALFSFEGNAQEVNALTVPIRFMVNGGNYETSGVTIERSNGSQEYVKGQSNITIHLPFNDEYILSFKKEGYITKKIFISTKVPSDRSSQGFDTYNFDIVIFPQEDDVNLVVFNQPVARINYNKKIDDFDYDVDYTKRIQSAIRQAEAELEQAAKDRKKQESKQADTKKKDNVNSETTASIENKQSDQSNAKAVLNTQKGSDEIAQANVSSGDDQKTSIGKSGKDRPDKSKANTGKDKKKESAINSGKDEKPPLVNVHQGIDDQSNLLASAEDEGAPVFPQINRGNDKPDDDIQAQKGSDQKPQERNVPYFAKEMVKVSTSTDFRQEVTVQEIDEARRHITLVRVEKNGEEITYHRVIYDWGAVYYFVNYNTPITADYFKIKTGIKSF